MMVEQPDYIRIIRARGKWLLMSLHIMKARIQVRHRLKSPFQAYALEQVSLQPGWLKK